MVTVTIQVSPLHDEQEVYFCPSAEIEVQLIEMPDARIPDMPIKWVVFTPTNGHTKGELTRVPYERLISISEPLGYGTKPVDA